MYINPFLAGVLCTLVFEIIAVFLYGLFFVRRDNGKEDDDHEDS